MAPPRRAAATVSFDLRQFFQIDALDPLLQFLGVLVLYLDLHEITIGDHHPKRGVFLWLVVVLAAGVTVNRYRFAVSIFGFTRVIPGSGSGADIIWIGNGIE